MRVPKVREDVPTSAPKQPRRVRSRDPEFEVALGARIRAARVAAHMSQVQLAAAIGVTFQQMQKYENGRDRVSVSTLRGVATALGVHPSAFFDDMPAPVGKVSEARAMMRAVQLLQQIRSPRVLEELLALARAVVDAHNDESDSQTSGSVEPD